MTPSSEPQGRGTGVGQSEDGGGVTESATWEEVEGRAGEYARALGNRPRLAEMVAQAIRLRRHMGLPCPPGRALPPAFYAALVCEVLGE